MGGGPPSAGAFDGVLNGGENTWVGRKRGPSSAWQTKPDSGHEFEEVSSHVVKEEEIGPKDSKDEAHSSLSSAETSHTPSTTHESGDDSLTKSMRNLSVDTNQGGEYANGSFEGLSKDPGNSSGDLINIATVQWSYLDPLGNVQGQSTKWFSCYIIECHLFSRSFPGRYYAKLA